MLYTFPAVLSSLRLSGLQLVVVVVGGGSAAAASLAAAEGRADTHIHTHARAHAPAGEQIETKYPRRTRRDHGRVLRRLHRGR